MEDKSGAFNLLIDAEDSDLVLTLLLLLLDTFGVEGFILRN